MDILQRELLSEHSWAELTRICTQPWKLYQQCRRRTETSPRPFVDCTLAEALCIPLTAWLRRVYSTSQHPRCHRLRPSFSLFVLDSWASAVSAPSPSRYLSSGEPARSSDFRCSIVFRCSDQNPSYFKKSIWNAEQEQDPSVVINLLEVL